MTRRKTASSKTNKSVIPQLFWERLQDIVPSEYLEMVKGRGLINQAPTQEQSISLRINTLKAGEKEIFEHFSKHHILFDEEKDFPNTLMVDKDAIEKIDSLGFFENGYLYRQNLSSMLAALVLSPRPGDRVLDFCAAPGSKTTQMAAMMENQGTIIACESVKERFYKLKSVIELLGARIIEPKLIDARRFKDEDPFDKILVDAPCSSEGRFDVNNPKTFAYWSPRKIKEMVHKQRGLLLSASRFLKPGGTLVYSTCTFAPEENEGVVDWFLRKSNEEFKVEDIETSIPRYPVLSQWGEKSFDPQVKKCLRVLPSKEMDGFFITKFIKQ